MSNIASLIRIRRDLMARRDLLTQQKAILDGDNVLRTAYASNRLTALEQAFANPDSASERAFRQSQQETLATERTALKMQVEELEELIRALSAQHDEMLAEEQPLGPSPGIPIALFPIRIETCFVPAEPGVDLLVRVYPDDIHVDAPAREPAGNDGQLARGTRASLLPHHWTVYGVAADQLLFCVEGKEIPENVPLSTLRDADADPASGDANVAKTWFFDLDAAVALGMAVRIHLEDPRPVIDQLFVLGVSQLDEAKGAERFVAALTSHATRGALEFIPPGAATNNTADAPSAWHSGRQQPTALRDGDVPALDPLSFQNAALLARAFGIDGAQVLASVPAGTADWQTAPGVMIDALWPALTVDWEERRRHELNFEQGFFSLQRSSDFDEKTYRALKSDAAKFLRGRGPLPTIRVGRQPYGILPASSLDLWKTADDSPIESLKVRVLRHLLPFWRAGLMHVPTVRAQKDQDQAILDALGRDAVSRRVVYHPVLGENNFDAVEPLAIIPDISWKSGLLITELSGEPQPWPEEMPLVGNPEELKQYWERRRQIVDAHIAAPPADPDTIDQAARLLTTPEGGLHLTKSLLYALFNYGQIIESNALIPFNGFATAEDSTAHDVREAKEQSRLLQGLTEIAAEEYEPLLLETLDLFSHRIDAWITSLATQRLDQLRANQPQGCLIGGYGWVERLTPAEPAPAAPTRIPGFNEVRAREADTYVLAPSLQHAATATVLRSGFDAHTNEQAFGVNLTSRRARVARWILDGVRAGQTLGALLGYRFERGLHEVNRDDLIESTRVQFSIAAPPDPDAGPTAANAREAIASRNVVDGLALYHAATGTNERPLTQAAAATLERLQTSVKPLLEDLANVVDAVGDLILAESVHHLVGGNALRAGLAADSVGRGESLPSRFDVIANQRSGLGLSCSVAVLLPLDVSSHSTGWNLDRPRSALAPQAEAWVEELLRDASSWRIACDVKENGATHAVECGLEELDVCALDVVFELESRSPGTASVLERRIVYHVGRQASAGASVAISTNGGADAWRALAALVERIIGVLRAAQPLRAAHLDPLEGTPDPSPSPAAFTARIAQLSVEPPSKSLEALRDAAGVLVTAATDLEREKAAAEVAIAGAADLGARVRRYLDGLASTAAALRLASEAAANAATPQHRATSAGALALALAAVSDFGIEGSYPLATGQGIDNFDVIVEQGRLVREHVDRLDLPNTGVALKENGTLRAWTDDTKALLSRVLGDLFPIIPLFMPSPSGQLSTSLHLNTAPEGADLPAMMLWLRRLSRVRSAVRDLHDLLLFTELRTARLPALKIVQLPFTPGDRWAALPYEGQRPLVAQRTAVLHMPVELDGSLPLAGLLIDGWTERLPGLTAFRTAQKDKARSEVTGLAFHFDRPDAEPPHAVLVVVPPDLSRPWTESTLLQVVSETLDLAKLRAMDHRNLPRTTPVVPISYVLNPFSEDWPS
jgi:hypothetical protein